MEVINIREAYIRRLEKLLDETSVVRLIDDKTNVQTILGQVTYLIAFYTKNHTEKRNMFGGINPDYIRRMRTVQRLFIAYQEGMMD